MIITKGHTQIHTHQESRVLRSCWANTHTHTRTKLRPELGPKIMFIPIGLLASEVMKLKSPRPKCYWHSGFMIITQASDSSYFPLKLLLETTSTNFLNPRGPFFNFVARGTWNELTQREGGGHNRNLKLILGPVLLSHLLQRVTIQCLQACLKQRDIDIKIS